MSTNVIRTTVNGNMTTWTHLARVHKTSDMFEDGFVRPVFFLPRGTILSARMSKFWIRLVTADAFFCRILLTLNLVHFSQMRLQLAHRSTLLWFGPVFTDSLRSLHDAIFLRLMRRIPDYVDTQAQRPQRQFWRKIEDYFSENILDEVQ